MLGLVHKSKSLLPQSPYGRSRVVIGSDRAEERWGPCVILCCVTLLWDATPRFGDRIQLSARSTVPNKYLHGLETAETSGRNSKIRIDGVFDGPTWTPGRAFCIIFILWSRSRWTAGSGESSLNARGILRTGKTLPTVQFPFLEREINKLCAGMLQLNSSK